MSLEEVGDDVEMLQTLAFEPHMSRTGTCVRVSPQSAVDPGLKRYHWYQLSADKTLTAR
jgi:hypothetical protein